MSYLRANFATRPSGKHGGSQVSAKRRIAVEAAKLAGSITIFKRGKELIVE